MIEKRRIFPVEPMNELGIRIDHSCLADVADKGPPG
jgi:hypothetical protein